MTETYFTDIENIIKSRLGTAKRIVRIAAAWINFREYQNVFEALLAKRVKLEIMTNDIPQNKYPANIAAAGHLCQLGAIIQIKNFGSLMHHKFCVIDEDLCISGSFNWTQTANTKNLENIFISDDSATIYKYIEEFEALQVLSAENFQALRNPEICERCREPILYIFGFEQEGYYYTRVHIFRHCCCDCDIGKEVYNDLLDISFYNNFEGLIEYYSDLDERYYGEMTKEEADRLSEELSYRVKEYCSGVRFFNIGSCPIIHAVGVKDYKITDKDGDGYWRYKIIWIERGMERFVENEYEL